METKDKWVLSVGLSGIAVVIGAFLILPSLEGLSDNLTAAVHWFTDDFLAPYLTSRAIVTMVVTSLGIAIAPSFLRALKNYRVKRKIAARFIVVATVFLAYFVIMALLGQVWDGLAASVTVYVIVVGLALIPTRKTSALEHSESDRPRRIQ